MKLMDGRILIEVDARGRTILGALPDTKNKFYLGHQESDGTIVLRPAAVVPSEKRGKNV